MSIVIASRFRGPTTSGNGGYTAGLVAARLIDDAGPQAVTVTLRLPPPLERELAVGPAGTGIVVTDGADLVAEAALAPPEDAVVLDDAVVPAVPTETAREISASYPGFHQHPFPECFVCGPAREPGDGLRLFPGRLPDGRTACVWDVAPDVAGRPEFVWAALDCPGGWAAPIEGRPMVLGRITARVFPERAPAAGDACVVTGKVVGSEGRKVWTATTLHAPDGVVIGSARATWIVLPEA